MLICEDYVTGAKTVVGGDFDADRAMIPGDGP
jgi:hypothetical protein